MKTSEISALPTESAPSSDAGKKEKLPRFCLAIYVLCGISLFLYLAFVQSPDFADWFNKTVSVAGRRILAYLTSWIPFSTAELLLILLPFWLVLLVTLAVRNSRSLRAALRYAGILLSVIGTVLVLFVWNFAAGYYGTSLDQKLQLERKAVSAEELSGTAEILAGELRVLTDEVTFLEGGTSLMPYSYRELSHKLTQAYDRLADRYDFVDSFSSTVKPVMLSEPMSYTHITGVYTFFTGEANLNVNFPDYTLPYTAAHEMAHQRGFAREDEANFVAFLVCMESDDPYIRYSACLNVFKYVASALYRADADAYREVYAGLPAQIRAEEHAYSLFFDKYRDNVAANVSQATNDAYLKSQGSSEGTRSYNMVVDLTVAYYRSALSGNN